MASPRPVPQCHTRPPHPSHPVEGAAVDRAVKRGASDGAPCAYTKALAVFDKIPYKLRQLVIVWRFPLHCACESADIHAPTRGSSGPLCVALRNRSLLLVSKRGSRDGPFFPSACPRLGTPPLQWRAQNPPGEDGEQVLPSPVREGYLYLLSMADYAVGELRVSRRGRRFA